MATTKKAPKAGPATPGTPAGFAGFGAKALPFFEALAFHQTKDWFEENRGLYESEVKQPLGALIADLSAALKARGIPLGGDPKRSIFRIHRDVRFSRNKDPYKTHAGATLTRDGGKLSPGLLYVHVASPKLDEGGSFMALGFYQPEPDQLKAMRQAIVDHPAAWRTLADGLAGHGLTLSDEFTVSRIPGGLPTDLPADLAAAVKRKSFIVRRPIAVADLRKASLVDAIATFAAEAKPLLDFGWRAIDPLRET